MESVADEVRILMARHLQSHTWSESAYTLECVKGQRWHLGASGKATEGVWRDIMCVTKQKQTLFIQRVHFGFKIKRRQVRTATHARLNPESWESLMDNTCLLTWALECMATARTQDGSAALFPPDVLRIATQKVLEGSFSCLMDF